MSTAIFGGTFDPVHKGHIRIALSAMEQFELDKVIVVPNANPPHKRNEITTDFKHRYNMLKLAFAGIENIEISDYESKDNKYHYSLHTMRYFREAYGEDTYFILGADSLCTIHLWYEYEKFLSENRFIVFFRENDEEFMKFFTHYKAKGAKLYLADMPFFDASSSKIREALGSGEVPVSILTSEVALYIKANGLYGGRI